MTPAPPRSNAPCRLQGRRGRWKAFVLAVATIPPMAVAAEDPPAQRPPVVESLGLVVVPADVVEPDGARTPIAELSGITWLGGDSYLAVMDSGDRAVVLAVLPSPEAPPAAGDEGTPGGPPPAFAVDLERTIALDGVRDWEDVAVGAEHAGGRWLFAVEEDTPAIRAFRLDGPAPAVGDAARPRGMHSLADVFRSARANRGPESLTHEPDSLHVWTANEEPLERDGPPVADGTVSRVRLVRVPVGGDPERAREPRSGRVLVYPVDPPHARIGTGTGPLYCGVVALVALGGGRLLVLERSAAVGLPPFENRIYLVTADDPGGADPIGDDPIDAGTRALSKSLLWRGALGVNLEGLCVGPPLADGRRLLVGVADNGGTGGPNVVALFTIEEPAAVTTP